MLFELRDVSLARGDRLVLDAVSVEIQGGATAIVGPSGSGKSTLLRLLNRLADPDTGAISYRGEPLTGYDPLVLRREVSLVPQLPSLLEGTVESNLAYAAGLAGKELDAVRCLGHAGLDPGFAARDVGKLSVGEQQRVMLARALAQGPQVLQGYWMRPAETAEVIIISTRMTKIQTRSCTCVFESFTPSKIKVMRATPVTP